MIAPLRFGYADTALGQLHYAEFGAGDPVLLLHQTPRSHEEFACVLPLLGQRRRAIAMDMYGFGRSAKPAAPQTIEQYADGAMALMNALGVDRFDVVGHHTGSAVAVEVSASQPNRVRAIVLSGASLIDESYRQWETANDGPGVDNAAVVADGSHLVTLWRKRQPFYPEGDHVLLTRFLHDALAAGVDPMEGHRACARYRMEDRLPLVQSPVLVIAAGRDPFTFDDRDRFRSALTAAPAVQIAVLADGMVPLPDQLPAEYAATVEEFLSARAPQSADV